MAAKKKHSNTCFKHCQHDDLCAENAHLKRVISEQEIVIKKLSTQKRLAVEVLLKKLEEIDT